MLTVRRFYIYLVSAISLQAIVWATITLLRNASSLWSQTPVGLIALQIAIILIGLPIFLIHWLWAQRLARQDMEERGSSLRKLYLFGLLAGSLGPAAANTFALMSKLVGSPFGSLPYTVTTPDIPSALSNHLAVLPVLAVLWWYHWRALTADARLIPETGKTAAIRRLYVYGFSAAGLTMTALGLIHLLRWILFQLAEPPGFGRAVEWSLAVEIARLGVGIPLWLVHWTWAHRMFSSGRVEERESALRQFYLYGVVFVSALATVANATGILASLIRRLVGLQPSGDLRIPLPVIIGMGIFWAYHALILSGDAQQAEKAPPEEAPPEQAPRQAGIRRLYLYLIGAVGLAALLVGLSGDISVVFQSFTEGFGDQLREQLSWFTAAIVAGLPVWVLPWRPAQSLAATPGPVGAGERRSVVRKIYLYFFIFVATMALLSGAVFIVYRLLSMVLGAEALTFSELGQALSFCMIAIGVWLYHGAALRQDGRFYQRDQAEQLKDLHVAIVDFGDDNLGQALIEKLRREFSGLNLAQVGFALENASVETNLPGQEEAVQALSQADLIIAPWSVMTSGGMLPSQLSAALAASPATKLLIPVRVAGWEWAGVEIWDDEALVRQAVQALRQWVEGEQIRVSKPLGLGALIAIVVGVLVLLSLLVMPLVAFFSGNF